MGKNQVETEVRVCKSIEDLLINGFKDLATDFYCLFVKSCEY
jgi:hypothetical protein